MYYNKGKQSPPGWEHSVLRRVQSLRQLQRLVQQRVRAGNGVNTSENNCFFFSFLDCIVDN